MRQIGILCAAALVALKENVGKLESDHKKTRLLAGKYIMQFEIQKFFRNQNLFF